MKNLPNTRYQLTLECSTAKSQHQKMYIHLLQSVPINLDEAMDQSNKRFMLRKQHSV